MVGKLFAFIYG